MGPIKCVRPWALASIFVAALTVVGAAAFAAPQEGGAAAKAAKTKATRGKALAPSAKDAAEKPAAVADDIAREREAAVAGLRHGGGGAPQDATSKPSDPQDEAKAKAVAEAAQNTTPPAAVQETPDFEPIPNRWYEPPLPWALLPPPVHYQNEPGRWWDPYRQNWLKGDFPIIGQDVFFALTFTEKVVVEGRNIPTGSGITGPNANNQNFFGDGEQLFVTSKTAISFDVFKGQQAFKPVDWRVRVTPVFDVTHISVEELGGVNINVADGRSRTTGDVALQEALVEIHLADLSDRFDFVSSEFGILPFRSDFRGFIFEDTNLGVRLFGNLHSNQFQYNLVFFDMLEKDTFSDLNRFDLDRDQQVLIANVYIQDFLGWLGYTMNFSFHWNHDNGSTHFDRADFLVRPQPVGLAREKSLDAYYLGFAGEGKLGKFNITHAFYQVLGEEENNAFATNDTNINARFAAAEISYDIDWARIRAYGIYASGDDNTLDHDANGFDAILDNPAFAGGEFSFWQRQNIKLLGVGLVQRNSFLPDLTTSKSEGQANFVNPGLLLLGGAVDFEITPTWRGQIGANYMRFLEPDPLQVYLQTEDIDQEIGTEIFLGTQWRPLLTNNILITVGGAVLFPGNGYQKIYQSDEEQWHMFVDFTFTF